MIKKRKIIIKKLNNNIKKYTVVHYNELNTYTKRKNTRNAIILGGILIYSGEKRRKNK